jgi:phosphoribosylpyrophosphate synthetase
MLLSELRFGAFLSYSPRGDSDEIRRSREWTYALKRDAPMGAQRRPTSQLVAERVRARLEDGPLGELFSSTTSLVPVPGAGLWRPGDLWVSAATASALCRVGLGAEMLPCLRRRTPIRRSSQQQDPAVRPSVAEHAESMAVDVRIPAPVRILLIDDVVTRGATLLAAASRLVEAWPGIEVCAFAVVRTISNPSKFDAIYAPVVGTIAFDGEQTRRRP